MIYKRKFGIMNILHKYLDEKEIKSLITRKTMLYLGIK